MRPSGSDIPRARPTSPPRNPVDLGWLFLLPGIVLIAAAVLIAAEDDLYEAKFRRDEALAIEARHAERVERYASYLDAVKRRDPTVMRSLVVGQLNSEFTDLVEARLPGVPVYDSTEVFASLEPPEAAVARRERVDSVLARWATDNGSRVWLLASGALCVFVGLLPPVNRRGGIAVAEDDQDQDETQDEPDDTQAEGLAEDAQTDEVDQDADDTEASVDEDEVKDEADEDEAEADEVDEAETELSDEAETESDTDAEDETDPEATADAEIELNDEETAEETAEGTDDGDSDDEVITEDEDDTRQPPTLWQQPRN